MMIDASAHRQIDVEDPAPTVVIGQPAAEHRTEHGRDHDAESPESHRLAAILWREGFEHHRLRKRLQRAAGRALNHAEEDQHAAGSAPGRRATKPTVNPVTAAISVRLRPK